MHYTKDEDGHQVGDVREVLLEAHPHLQRFRVQRVPGACSLVCLVPGVTDVD